MAGTVVSGDVPVSAVGLLVLILAMAVGIRLPLDVTEMCSDDAVACENHGGFSVLCLRCSVE